MNIYSIRPVREQDVPFLWESPIFADLTATVATTSILAAGQYGTINIVYIGSSFIENDNLKDVVEVYTRFKGATLTI